MKVGKDPAKRDLGASGPYTFDEVTVTSTFAPELQVCAGLNIGESCSHIAAAPSEVKCFASSATSIDVEWRAVDWVAATAQGEGGLLTGYKVTAFALGNQIVTIVNSTAENRVTFTRDAVNINQRLKYDVVYSVQVEALYNKETIRSKPAMCVVPLDGMPCIPYSYDGGDVGTVARSNSILGASNCPCLTSHQVYDKLNQGTQGGRGGENDSVYTLCACSNVRDSVWRLLTLILSFSSLPPPLQPD